MVARTVASVSVTVFERSVVAMNPYEANLSNTASRLRAWVFGMVRLYRQPLLALAAAGAVMAVGVSATRAPAQSPQQPPQPVVQPILSPVAAAAR